MINSYAVIVKQKSRADFGEKILTSAPAKLVVKPLRIRKKKAIENGGNK
jgi:hypothetical protein